MTESEIQKGIIDYSKAAGCICIRMNSGYSGRNNIKLSPPGTPDLLIISRAGVIWVEVKTGKGGLRQSQIEMHGRLRELGQTVIVARSIEDVIKYI